MKELRYTLLSHGSSNLALLPVLDWLLRENGVVSPLDAAWADLRHLPTPPGSLAERICACLHYHPCELLFVQRDAEKQPYSTRREEIQRALEAATRSGALPPAVCVIPVRMQEAWLLFDELAIRRAAGNPNGTQALALPPIRTLEDLPGPKQDLHELLRIASGLTGRRRRALKVSALARRVAEFMTDFTPLRNLSAFHALEDDLRQAVIRHGWSGCSP